MGIQKDAGTLMIYLHERFSVSRARELDIDEKELSERNKLETVRVEKALEYLARQDLITMVKTGTGMVVSEIKPKGFIIAEDRNKFRVSFGFEPRL